MLFQAPPQKLKFELNTVKHYSEFLRKYGKYGKVWNLILHFSKSGKVWKMENNVWKDVHVSRLLLQFCFPRQGTWGCVGYIIMNESVMHIKQ